MLCSRWGLALPEQGGVLGLPTALRMQWSGAWSLLGDSPAPMHLSRKMKVVEALITLLQDFPYDDPTSETLHEDLDRIRGKFRQVRVFNLCLRGVPEGALEAALAQALGVM